MDLEHEAQEGLRTYRNNLIDAFMNTEISVDPSEIYDSLAAEGVASTSPIVTIPYTLEALERAVETKMTSDWHEPGTANRLEDALDKRKRLANGESLYDVGFPTVFYSLLLDIAVVIDDSDVCRKEWGDLYSRAMFVNSFAHEVTHSAFANLTEVTLVAANDTDKLRTATKCGIGQVVIEEDLERGGGTEREYAPIWIDEAFAIYTAGLVRQRMYPESIPKEPYTFTGDSFETPAHYLVASKDPSVSPGDVGMPVAGVALERLDAKRPGTIDQIKQLANGKISATEFHANLRNSVGTELCADMVELRPYDTWPDTLKQVQEL